MYFAGVAIVRVSKDDNAMGNVTVRADTTALRDTRKLLQGLSLRVAESLAVRTTSNNSSSRSGG